MVVIPLLVGLTFLNAWNHAPLPGTLQRNLQKLRSHLSGNLLFLQHLDFRSRAVRWRSLSQAFGGWCARLSVYRRCTGPKVGGPLWRFFSRSSSVWESSSSLLLHNRRRRCRHSIMQTLSRKFGLYFRPLAPKETDFEFLFLIVSAGIAASCYLYLQLGMPWPGCWFRRLTGIPCPTCGATRCAMSLAHGDLVGAWRQNPLIFICYGGTIARGSLCCRRFAFSVSAASISCICHPSQTCPERAGDFRSDGELDLSPRQPLTVADPDTAKVGLTLFCWAQNKSIP